MTDDGATPRRRRRRGGRPVRDPANRNRQPRQAPRDPEEGITDPEEARAICLRQLALAPRTRAQLANAMRRRGVTAELAEALLERFEDVGLIDDAAFAASWVESRHVGRGIGRRKLAQELHTRGVSGALVRQAVDTLTPDTERATARALVASRLRGTAGYPAPIRARKLATMLARKGYPVALAFEVVREALAGEGIEVPEVEVPWEPDE